MNWFSHHQFFCGTLRSTGNCPHFIWYASAKKKKMKKKYSGIQLNLAILKWQLCQLRQFLSRASTHGFDVCFLFLMPLLVLDQKWLILSSISYINTTRWVCRPIQSQQLGGGVRKIASSRLAWAILEVFVSRGKLHFKRSASFPGT